ncbi:16S rRNA (adenine(1518)-N(6)/adenine(1519)-N(6))-dimethyltransferase RsmA [uncultured Desulfovibrio sp.]|uniref:16S rRNA (adenine(1518)-N(6)/adenine(1519)-N(6))- dimethyltransferase RsmA n=1 Tax=uncultured Desulfovibrio sp. TaxID=167968 RepID=UPI002633795D|nr:16S rRNA (adenine(1518)-N(6)/adenine(1519)-N(6))-dimethyltransferase RsmA [uncultured Desulfovibrio sp.]
MRCTAASGERPPAAKKSLGQHFLRRDDICTRIAALLLPVEDDDVIEIGPGPGALTRALEAQAHRRLLLLEKDRYWAAERQRLAGPHTQAALMDALRFCWRRITPEQPWKIAGNLPYNVASPLIWDMVSQATGWRRAVFMVQKEVGQRLAARPGTGQYGGLSVWVQSFAQPRLEFLVGPGAFSPPPKVDSAVLSFAPLPLERRPARPDLLAKLLRVCFQQRRKQLGGIFRHSGLPWLAEALTSMGLAPTLRPEMLSVDDFQRLTACWAERTPPGCRHRGRPDTSD